MDTSLPTVSLIWKALYITTAMLWALYAMAKTEEMTSSRLKLFFAFLLNLIICPIAILWAVAFPLKK